MARIYLDHNATTPVDEAVLDGYRRRLVAMTEVGLRPVVTLHHFTHPTWFHRETPWHLPESVAALAGE